MRKSPRRSHSLGNGNNCIKSYGSRAIAEMFQWATQMCLVFSAADKLCCRSPTSTDQSKSRFCRVPRHFKNVRQHGCKQACADIPRSLPSVGGILCTRREIPRLSPVPTNSIPAAWIHLLKLIHSCMPTCISQRRCAASRRLGSGERMIPRKPVNPVRGFLVLFSSARGEK